MKRSATEIVSELDGFSAKDTAAMMLADIDAEYLGDRPGARLPAFVVKRAAAACYELARELATAAEVRRKEETEAPPGEGSGG